MTDPDGPDFVSQAEFSRLRGVSRKTVTGWKAKGILVLDDRGRVDVASTAAQLDDRPATYRGGVTSRPLAPRAGNKSRHRSPARPDPPSAPSQSADEEDDPLASAPVDLSDFGIQSAAMWTLADATRVKEIYLALKRRQDFMIAEGKLVPIEEVALQVENEYAVVRERLLAIPGKLAASLVGLDQAAIEAAVEEEISEALQELHEPSVDRRAGDGGAASGTAEPRAGIA